MNNEKQELPVGWIVMMHWLIKQRGKHAHSHSLPGIWDDDNGPLAGMRCETCAMYDTARRMIAEAQS